ncbi:MAG: arsenosugar biosynthesis radical SAM (seleno)protein ArsS [Candidatus Kapaibacterium sp.]|jgi:radical SAM/Cys-rich protein
MKSINAEHGPLANTEYQLKVIQHGADGRFVATPFQDKLRAIGRYPLHPTLISIFQMNIGKMCNQTCKHCHVDAGPDRKERMPRQTMQACLDVLDGNPQLHTVDITGGAPEMNSNFRWLVEELSARKLHVIVRCNLTIILANPSYHDLPEFFKSHHVEVISSLPFYTQDRTDRQRGDGVFQESIKALQMLNAVGYGVKGSGLTLNLVYNPAGAFLPASQEALEQEYKVALMKDYCITFDKLFAITNLPISRYLDYLLKTGNFESYMGKLVTAFNPVAAEGVMCRNTISVGWDGYLYDCDFNQMLNLKVTSKGKHISEFNLPSLQARQIVTAQHCYGCTAGAGSSCGGANRVGSDGERKKN